MLFWDASALVKAYSVEEGSSCVLGAFARRQRGSLTDFVAAEVFSVLAKHWRTNKLSAEQYRAAVAEFSVDYPTSFYVFDVPSPIRYKAFELSVTYRSSSVSAMDLLHLATAVDLLQSRRKPVVFATSDVALQAVAKAEGLRTFNPEIDPLSKLLKLLSS